MKENMITLTDENQETAEFEILDILEYENEEYVVLYPADAQEEEPVHIFRVTSEDMDDGEETYEGIADQELLMEVYQQFCKRNGI